MVCDPRRVGGARSILFLKQPIFITTNVLQQYVYGGEGKRIALSFRRIQVGAVCRPRKHRTMYKQNINAIRNDGLDTDKRCSVNCTRVYTCKRRMCVCTEIQPVDRMTTNVLAHSNAKRPFSNAVISRYVSIETDVQIHISVPRR